MHLILYIVLLQYNVGMDHANAVTYAAVKVVAVNACAENDSCLQSVTGSSCAPSSHNQQIVILKMDCLNKRFSM